MMLLFGLGLTGVSLVLGRAEKKEPARGAALFASVAAPAGRHATQQPSSGAWVPTNAAGSNSNLWVYPLQPRLFALGPRPGVPMAAPPGVYESEPYKCIVVVPGAQWDDRSLVFRGDWTAPMPVRKPELRLVPRGK